MKCSYVVRRTALCCALVGALVHPQPTAAASYSTPDYSVSANVQPYTTSGPITIVYSTSNLSDVSAPATTVEFSAAPSNDPSKISVLGQAPVPALERWASKSQTVSFPLPCGLSVGTMGMRLSANINPARGNGEVKTTNNVTVSGFSAVVTSAPLPDLAVTALNAPISTAAGSAIAITDTVGNASCGSAGGFTIGYYLDGPTGRTTLANHTLSGLSANGNSLESFSVTVPTGLTSATYTLVVQANTTGSVAESNTGNNTATRSLTVTTTTGGSGSGSGSTGATTFVSTQSILPVPTVLRPLLHVPFTDPTFGTTITRMTDPSMAPSTSTNTTLGLRHEYSRYPALNASKTKMVVRVIGGADRGFFEVRDLTSGSLQHKIAPQRGDPEMSWHQTSPDRLFYRTTNEIRVFHTDTGQAEVLMAFPQYYAISTKSEGRPSDDWRYYAFLGFRDSSYTNPDIVVVDLVAKKVVTTWANAGKPDWVSMSPSGTYVIVQWTDGKGTRVYDRNTLAYLRTAFGDAAHSDFAYDAAGDEVIVYHATSSPALVELGSPSGCPVAQARLSDGKKTKLLDVGWGWFTPHFSGFASRQHPGWVLMSTYTTPENASQPYSREVLWLKLDGSGTVRRIAHHHSDQARPSTGKDYWAEPQATSSWDGSVVLFSSVWGQPFSHYDLYTVTGQWW